MRVILFAMPIIFSLFLQNISYALNGDSSDAHYTAGYICRDIFTYELSVPAKVYKPEIIEADGSAVLTIPLKDLKKKGTERGDFEMIQGQPGTRVSIRIVYESIKRWNKDNTIILKRKWIYLVVRYVAHAPSLVNNHIQYGKSTHTIYLEIGNNQNSEDLTIDKHLTIDGTANFADGEYIHIQVLDGIVIIKAHGNKLRKQVSPFYIFTEQ